MSSSIASLQNSTFHASSSMENESSQNPTFLPAQQFAELNVAPAEPRNLSDQGRSQGGRGKPPPETEKNVVEKWCYFRKLYF